MNKPRLALFKWRHFEPEIIVCAVRWYLRFSLSYRDARNCSWSVRRQLFFWVDDNYFSLSTTTTF